MDQTHQLDNACGVIACLHSIFNSDIELSSDSVLGKVLAETQNKSSAERASIIEAN